MPWCPKCKVEYQNGFTVCSDCKTELVESLENEEAYVPFIQADDKKIAEKLVRYFKYSDLKSTISYNEETEIYMVSIPPKQEKQARKLYQAFYFVERDTLERGDGEENLSTPVSGDESNLSDLTSEKIEKQDEGELMTEEAYEAETCEEDTPDYEAEANASAYVMKADQYKDLTGTVWIFLFFGIAGLIFVLLNIGGVFSFFNGFVPNLAMGALFAFFIYIALSTNEKAKKIQTEIEAENKLTDKINEWLTLNMTESFLASIHNDNISDELNYIKTTDAIKEMLIKEFDVQNLAYLDRLIEEYYSKTFDQEEL